MSLEKMVETDTFLQDMYEMEKKYPRLFFILAGLRGPDLFVGSAFEFDNIKNLFTARLRGMLGFTYGEVRDTPFIHESLARSTIEYAWKQLAHLEAKHGKPFIHHYLEHMVDAFKAVAVCMPLFYKEADALSILARMMTQYSYARYSTDFKAQFEIMVKDVTKSA